MHYSLLMTAAISHSCNAGVYCKTCVQLLPWRQRNNCYNLRKLITTTPLSRHLRNKFFLGIDRNVNTGELAEITADARGCNKGANVAAERAGLQANWQQQQLT
jgi:hypothetical protein